MYIIIVLFASSYSRGRSVDQTNKVHKKVNLYIFKKDVFLLSMSVKRVIKHWESSAGVLRQVCRRVNMSSKSTDDAAEDLLTTAMSTSCLGLAAPQIGLTSRMFVTRQFFGEEPSEAPLFHVISNPEILWRSPTKNVAFEGCLSIPDVQFSVARPYSISVAFNDIISERRVTKRLYGLEARVFQHEYDHLNGILLFQRAQKQHYMG